MDDTRSPYEDGRGYLYMNFTCREMWIQIRQFIGSAGFEALSCVQPSFRSALVICYLSNRELDEAVFFVAHANHSNPQGKTL